MKCCPNCFSDNFLKSQIENISNEKGKCTCCKTKNVTLISPQVLTDYFEALLEIYEKDNNGKSLNELIQEDWQIFSILNKTIQRKLIIAILQFDLKSNIKFKRVKYRDDIIVERWHLFTKELKYENRFIPQYGPNKDLFIEFGRFLGVVVKKQSQKMYRARICKEGTQYKIRDLRKPPANLVLNGRANPVGIPYLYIASTQKTAIAEIRGHKGEKVSVLEFEIKNDLNLFDLRNPRHTISPFEQIDDIEFIYRYMPYLELLENELSKPIIPKKANLDYLVSQYLCELIKQMNYHGIIYKSSIDSGNNYVIFNDNRLKALQIKEFTITEMKFETIPRT